MCWHSLVARASDECEPEWCDSEDPLFILYTSGSTGRPKVKQHTHCLTFRDNEKTWSLTFCLGFILKLESHRHQTLLNSTAAVPAFCARSSYILSVFMPVKLLLYSGLQGVLHTVSGYMLYAATTFKLVFDHHPDDIYWCTADIGWITGHSYITYGPLANGATSVLVSHAHKRKDVQCLAPPFQLLRPHCCVFSVVRGTAHLPGRQPDVGDCGQVPCDQVLHGADCRQNVDEVRKGAGAEVSDSKGSSSSFWNCGGRVGPE